MSSEQRGFQSSRVCLRPDNDAFTTALQQLSDQQHAAPLRSMGVNELDQEVMLWTVSFPLNTEKHKQPYLHRFHLIPLFFPRNTSHMLFELVCLP